MAKAKPLQTRPAAPQKLDHWMVDVLRSGQVILSGPPSEHWRRWRDGPEGLAAWIFHRAALLRGEDDPSGWWAVKRFDIGLTVEEIDREQQDSYFREMSSYREQQQRLLDEMAKRISAQKRRERGSTGEDVQ